MSTDRIDDVELKAALRRLDELMDRNAGGNPSDQDQEALRMFIVLFGLRGIYRER